MKKNRRISYILQGSIFPIAAFAALAVFAYSTNNLSDGRDEQALIQLENALHRGSVACYAAEGFYPPNLEYLEEHYGIRIDREHYAVDYNIFSENLMPDITVLEQTS